MKTSKDPRHLKRIKIVQDLFTWSFKKTNRSTNDIKPIVANLDIIDKLIEKAASDRPLSQINRIDLAILRNSIFELIIAPRFHRDHVISQHKGLEEDCDCDIIKKDAPLKVVVDEAVELGKEFGSDSTPSFLNGALGKIIEMEGITK
ncbi:hypothetical protein A3J13_01385 [Candidatus Daviesbacteria bacterium RIFCSPLOWO2_02_FULL_36_8]|uniref:NusB/RsmB/TIM44 domain-containing protein n=1 Tax=Candidatus Daviesbacteria bacterium RIFCSPLOWO2_02_FULL_36_8 TaxID=1797793 RepID=A0A1F5MG87_9BACT|nr:MAG: hypothetical protein A3J13_01385 [Candidatus Daviesbacteria bacterium RIFCSPLOWO2_02_FULL_36_8]